MARKTNKTPSQIREEIEAKLEAAKAREARALAKDNPQIQRVQQVYDSYSADIASISRQLKGPQSFANRREGFLLRLNEIDAGEALAVAQNNHYRSVRDYLKASLSILADRIANGEELNDNEISEIIDDAPHSDFDELFDLAEETRNARKAFTSSRSKKDDNETQAMEA